MSPLGRILSVALLAAAVAGVLALKNASNPPALPGPAEAANSDQKQPEAATAKPLPKLVDLGADKCIPCKKMAPILEELKREQAGKLEVVFIDVWKNPEAAGPYNIDLIPTQIFFGADGKELFRHEGFFPKEDLLAKWKELGVDMSAAGAGGEP